MRIEQTNQPKWEHQRKEHTNQNIGKWQINDIWKWLKHEQLNGLATGLLNINILDLLPFEVWLNISLNIYMRCCYCLNSMAKLILVRQFFAVLLAQYNSYGFNAENMLPKLTN
jgi:hypothetical protein